MTCESICRQSKTERERAQRLDHCFPKENSDRLYQNRQHLLGYQPSGLTFICESISNSSVLIIANINIWFSLPKASNQILRRSLHK